MKKKPFIIIFVLLVVLGAGAYGIKYAIDTINYHKTYEYKFITVGYTLEDTKTLDTLNTGNKYYLLELEYDKEIVETAEGTQTKAHHILEDVPEGDDNTCNSYDHPREKRAYMDKIQRYFKQQPH